MTEYAFLGIYEATFNPIRTDDLREGCDAFIGKTFHVRYAGTVEADYDYAGEDRWEPVNTRRADPDDATQHPPIPPCLWIPGCDLAIGQLLADHRVVGFHA